MSIQNIIDRFSSVTEFKQVVEAGTSATMPQIDTEELLTGVLKPTVNNNVYSLKLPESPTYPCISYMLVGGSGMYFEKHLVTQVDTFIVSLRAKSIEDLSTYAKTLIEAIFESSYALEITDKQKEFESGRDCYRLDLEITFTVPATGVNAETPALLIYKLASNAPESDYDNIIRQRVSSSYGAVILTASNNLEELSDVVMSRLLGYQQTTEHFEMQYVRGGPLENEGGLRMWRDVFEDSEIIQQTA